MSSKAGHMARVAPAVAPKSAVLATKPKQVGEDAQSGSKMHRRSRSGCFTCRLRRKKCDEARPHCRACKHLGLKCDYTRPLWWSNGEQRRKQKEDIKDIIKRTKLTEKAAPGNGTGRPEGADSPPGLTHSMPTSATYPDSALPYARAGSTDSYDDFDFNDAVGHAAPPYDLYNPQVYTPQFDAQFDPHFLQHTPASFAQSSPYMHGPYEVDIKTERQMFVNDVPTRTDTSVSTFSTFHPLHMHDALHTVHEEDTAWLQDEIYDDPSDLFGVDDDVANYGLFDVAHTSPSIPSQQTTIQVDEFDRPLLEHFIDHVLPLTFPILDVTQPGLARSEVILPALGSNRTYLHCALSAAAIHLKSTCGPSAHADALDNDILRHRVLTVTELCASFERNTDLAAILDATLGLIHYQSAVGGPDDRLPDIAWHSHFAAAADLLRRLELANPAPPPDASKRSAAHPPFATSLAAWIDILGATMLGRAPLFADTYRERHLAGRPLGLAPLMGCDDAVMLLISEVACLEALLLARAIAPPAACATIAMLGAQFDRAEPGPAAAPLAPATGPAGALRPARLAANLAACFRRAARVWLLSLVPGASKRDPTLRQSCAQLADLLDFVPAGPAGFDRSLVWPFLVAGGQSVGRDCPLRRKLEDRSALLGEPEASLGSFGRVMRLLREVWRREDLRDDGAGGACVDGDGDVDVHWRDVMREWGAEFLLI